MPEVSGLIHYRCRAPAHQQGADGRTPDTITVHEGRWSYCPLDARGDGHVWEETGGVPIESLRRAAPTINLDVSPPRPARAAAGASVPARAAPAPAGAPKARSRKRTTPS